MSTILEPDEGAQDCLQFCPVVVCCIAAMKKDFSSQSNKDVLPVVYLWSMHVFMAVKTMQHPYFITSICLPAEISTVLCDNQSKAEMLLQTREKGQTPVLKTVIIMDSFSSELVERGTKCGVEVLSMQDVEVLHVDNK